MQKVSLTRIGCLPGNSSLSQVSAPDTSMPRSRTGCRIKSDLYEAADVGHFFLRSPRSTGNTVPDPQEMQH
jgi:hypothetical protein